MPNLAKINDDMLLLQPNRFFCIDTFDFAFLPPYTLIIITLHSLTHSLVLCFVCHCHSAKFFRKRFF